MGAEVYTNDQGKHTRRGIMRVSKEYLAREQPEKSQLFERD